MPLIAALCLAAGTWHARLPAETFTLRWQHSIEKTEWDEDWSVAGDWLYLSQARIRGSGAGMDPPPDARLFDGAWVYRPADPWRREIVLARSSFVRDYDLCVDGRCRALSAWIPVRAGPTTLAACAARGESTAASRRGAAAPRAGSR